MTSLDRQARLAAVIEEELDSLIQLASTVADPQLAAGVLDEPRVD